MTEPFEKEAPATSQAEQAVPLEEEALLARAVERLAQGVGGVGHETKRYDAELVALRDEIAEARLEDVPALMRRWSACRASPRAAPRREGPGRSARALLRPPAPAREASGGSGTERDVLIGKSDATSTRKAGVRIVDWRHAPVSQLYYRYAEGSEYEETFGEREVEGEVLARRTVTIDDGDAPAHRRAARHVRARDARLAPHRRARHELAGGQGTAVRPGDMRGVARRRAPAASSGWTGTCPRSPRSSIRGSSS